MVVKCPNCDGALIYDAMTDKMLCEHCNSSFFLYQIQTREQKKERINEQAKERITEEAENIECKLFNCTSCGATLMINNVESSTYCAYCGQPTIVFERVSMQKKPKYIIPFSVSKENAEQLIRKRMNKGAFVPKEVKNIRLDTIRGIYIPYWFVDIHYEDDVILSAEKSDDNRKNTVYYYRKAKTDFINIPVDASKSFNDNLSHRLEPFIVSERKKFDAKYLSGYYADCSDEVNADLNYKARHRAQNSFDEEILKSVEGTQKKIVYQNPQIEIKKKEYALLPVWFMVFKYLGKDYTMMVNGQTGKVVGAVPYRKIELFSFLFIMTAILSLFTVPTIYTIVNRTGGNGIETLMYICSFSAILIIATIHKYKSYRRSRELTEDERFSRFVKKRQGGSK